MPRLPGRLGCPSPLPEPPLRGRPSLPSRRESEYAGRGTRQHPSISSPTPPPRRGRLGCIPAAARSCRLWRGRPGRGEPGGAVGGPGAAVPLPQLRDAFCFSPPGTPAHTCTHPEVRSLLCRNGKSKQASGLLCQGDFTGLGQPAPCPELPPVGTLKRTSVVSGRSKPKPTKPESPERGCGESEGRET